MVVVATPIMKKKRKAMDALNGHAKKHSREVEVAESERAEGAAKVAKKRKRLASAGDSATPEPVAADAAGVMDISGIPEISKGTRKVLQARGITSLFEIQQRAFAPAFSGKDVVGRAKTGCGKTLAFVLPTVERIRALELSVKGGRRVPVCLAVAPTRELARQIFADVESIGAAAGLQAKCFYGGTAFGPQCEDLRGGIDLLVGTPGRLLDHIRRQTADLSHCRVLVLDEADEMLSMGFQEDVEAILNALPKENLQKLLFSATLPKWVNALVEKHLVDPVWIDVTRDDDANATNRNITHKCVSCPPFMRGDCIGDLCKVHAGYFGKTLVFTGTKKECDELAATEKLSAMGVGVLHGDIGQNQREAVMEGFRSGRLKCLVATDVAARGLDVPAVDLVVQTHPPQDLDMYVHRSGRTARAGREGTSVTFYSQREEYILRLLEHKKGIKMQRVGPPQPEELVTAATHDAVKQLDHVHQDSVDAFLERARELISDRGAEVALAASLAALTGHARRLKGRSLLSAFEGFTAMLFESERGIENSGKGWYLLRQMLPQDVVSSCKGLVCCTDGKTVIFDVPDDMVPRIQAAESHFWRGCKVSVATVLPELQERQCDYREAAQQLKEKRQQHWQKIQERKRAEASDRGGHSGKGGGRGGAGDSFSEDLGRGRGRGRGFVGQSARGSGFRGRGGRG